MRHKFIKFFGLLVFISSSCGAPDNYRHPECITESRFFEISVPNDKCQSNYEIIVDKETRVMYLHMIRNTGLTPLLDKDGKVTFYDGEIE